MILGLGGPVVVSGVSCNSLDADGTLDDFYATGVQSIHFEALDEAAWYCNVHMADGRIWQLNFGAKNQRARGYATEERVR